MPRPDLPALTGLRGVAALWVVAFHFHATRISAWGPGEVLRHGYLAVDLFFVLSGFLMLRAYGGLFQGGVRPASCAVFLIRRLARVYPVYLAATLLFIGLSALGYTGSDKPVTPGLVALNLAMMQTWFTNVSYDIPGWSISTEFAAYLAFPVLARPAGRLPAGWAGLLLLACVGLLGLVSGLPDAAGSIRRGPLDLAWGSPPWALARCAVDFVLGLLAGRLSGHAAVRRALAGPAVGALLLLAFALLLATPGADVPAVALMPALLIALAVGSGAPVRLLSGGVAGFLGEVSYALYLLHYLAVTFEAPVLRHVPAAVPRWAAEAGYHALSYPGLLLASWVVYRLLERPARAGVRRWERFVAAPARESTAGDKSA